MIKRILFFYKLAILCKELERANYHVVFFFSDDIAFTKLDLFKNLVVKNKRVQIHIIDQIAHSDLH